MAEQRWTIRADGPDGRVDHFHADTDLGELEVCPVAELESERERADDHQRWRTINMEQRNEAEQKVAALIAAVEEHRDTLDNAALGMVTAERDDVDNRLYNSVRSISQGDSE